MTTTRRIGAVAALGGMAMAAALLTGLSGAYADELSDLRANQQLLQQKLDQLQLAIGAAPVAPGAPSLAGSFPRSFLIPGTNTSLAIGGFVKADVDYFFNGGTPSNPNGVVPSVQGAPFAAGLPLKLPNPPGIAASPFQAKSRGNSVLHMSAYFSRLRVETRTPTSWGEADTVIELDFGGCPDNTFDCRNLAGGTFPLLPRLRYAYATLGGFLAGQATIPVTDNDAAPDLIDTSGDAGSFGFARAPWFGYTWQLPAGMSFLAAAVTPSTSFWGPGGPGAANGALLVDSAGTGIAGTMDPVTNYAVNPAKTSAPDLNFVWRLNRPWGNLQLSTAWQDLKLQDGAYLNKSYIGYGGGFGVHILPFPRLFPKDNFGLNGYLGTGLGHYANPPGSGEPTTSNALATNFGGPAVDFYGSTGPVTRANARLVLASTVTQFGAEGNFQHFWTPNWRSTISGGFQTNEIPTTLVGPATVATQADNKTIITAHANIIWSPVAFIDTGLEYFYAHRLTIYRQSGTGQGLDFQFKVKF